MNYIKTLHYLKRELPMFQRIGAKAFKADLQNITALCQKLGNPQQQFKSIHIAGTNGKGSTAHILAAILQESGYKVGLHTSPHYHDLRERTKINGKWIREEEVIAFVEKNKKIFEEIKPSFFELSVAMAFDFFAKQKVDIAIIETGLGGRLDATNIIAPLLSIITNISLEHTAFLGNTLAEIAGEKAGIIKAKTPVIISETQGDIKGIFEQKAIENQAIIYFADENLVAKNIKAKLDKMSFDVYDKRNENKALYKNISSDLVAIYQTKNIIAVLQAAEILPQMSFEKVNQKTIFSALKKVCSLTNFIGRWQILSTQKPFIIADSSHNEAGIKVAMQQLSNYDFENLHLVLGFVKSKEDSHLWEILPKKATYYFCCANIPRALPADILAEKSIQYNLKGKAFASVKQAFDAAKRNAKANDMIYIGGSIYVVAEIFASVNESKPNIFRI